MALLEPFIDTVVICTMTALVIIIFNFGGFFEYGGDGGNGILMELVMKVLVSLQKHLLNIFHSPMYF